MDHAFGRKPPYGVGIEEELLLVDPISRELSNTSTTLLPRVHATAGKVMHDVYEALVESASPRCSTAGEATQSLLDIRAALHEAGATLAGAGIHPTAVMGDVQHVGATRYRAIASHMRGLLRRTPTCALHVHVGMPDADTAIAACNAMRAHLPLLQALAANSPYWFGMDSGFATARAQLFRAYPRAEIPRHFADWDDYVATVEAVVAVAEGDDYTHLWWDVRPHPNLGTLEVRAMDAQTEPESVAALGALVHSLAVACAHEPSRVPVPPREALVELSFRAGRDGLGAQLWWDGRSMPAHAVAERTLELARPYARDLGCEDELALVSRILTDGNGADRQRAAHARGGMQELLLDLVGRTAVA